jgi:hypothetical protein
MSFWIYFLDPNAFLNIFQTRKIPSLPYVLYL